MSSGQLRSKSLRQNTRVRDVGLQYERHPRGSGRAKGSRCTVTAGGTAWEPNGEPNGYPQSELLGPNGDAQSSDNVDYAVLLRRPFQPLEDVRLHTSNDWTFTHRRRDRVSRLPVAAVADLNRSGMCLLEGLFLTEARRHRVEWFRKRHSVSLWLCENPFLEPKGQLSARKTVSHGGAETQR